MADPSNFEPYYADSAGRDGIQGENRTQRNTLALRDVAYLIEASVEQPNGFSKSDPPVKYREMFQRRVERGQCFQQPYMGIREFVASFSLPDGEEIPPEELRRDEDRDLGLMLFDIDFTTEPHRPLFADAKLRRGVLDVEEMRRAATGQEVLP
jgi:CRISPR-associated protein Cas5d